MTAEHFLLHENGWLPNNEALPVLVYRGAVSGSGEEAAKAFEALFGAHGWPPQWRDIVYDYHHYHSTAHEALGVAAGTAVLTLGGPAGRRVEVRAGDALVLPVGTGHRSVERSDDFLVVGAYPAGQDWDICTDAPSPAARQRMRDLGRPAVDPVAGAEGPLTSLWR